MGSVHAARQSKPPEDLNENALLSLLTPKTIFVSSGSYTGDLVSEAYQLGDFAGTDGLLAADYICQHLADGAGLKGTYRAVLSSTTQNANARISTSLGPYRLVTGTPVAENYAALFGTSDGTDASTPDLPPKWLISSVVVTELGDSLEGPGSPTSRRVWTGSQANGALGPPVAGPPGSGFEGEFTTCEDWTSDASEVECEDFNDVGVCGVTGQSLDASPLWLNTAREGCDNFRRLYCAEQ